LARRATFIKQSREKYPQALLLDAGNALAGTEGLAASTKGKANIEAMNLLAYNALALGELDLSLGPTILRERMKEARFPFLSANTVISQTGQLFAQPYIILNVGGRRVGIVGLTEPLPPLPRVAGEKETLLVRDPIQFGRPYVEKVVKEAEIVILLSHMGQALDEALAAQVSGIDVIIGSKDRTVLVPVRYGGAGPVIAQAGSQGQFVGFVELKIDRAGVVIAFSGKAELLTEKYADDPEVVKLLSKYR